MKRILLLRTGGTIAMEIRRQDGAETVTRKGEHGEHEVEMPTDHLSKYVPQLCEIAHVEMKEVFFKDSSDIHPEDWGLLARTIYEVYDEYDGFVILHGTDTMAYTASALSFAFQHLSKPIILTGSQVPVSVLRSDAPRNLVNAVQLATLPFNEVAICFNDKIFRGNRSTKVSIGDFTAFYSPNHPAIAEIGLNIEIKYVISPSPHPVSCRPEFSTDVLLLTIYPGMKPKHYLPLLENGFRCVIFSAFGSGNFPVTGEYSLLPLLEACAERDILMVMTSQALYDAVDLDKYESGRRARDLGVISAGDMTREAALTKMMHLLARYKNPLQIRDQYVRPLVGELTQS
jgi:L-asparaginase